MFTAPKENPRAHGASLQKVYIRIEQTIGNTGGPMGLGFRTATSGLRHGSDLLVSCAVTPRIAFQRPGLRVSFPGRQPYHTAFEKWNGGGVYRRAVD